MKVEHPDLKPFEPMLKDFLHVAHTSGVQSLESVGLSLQDIKTNRSAHRRFIRGCHYGFDKAQRKIADKVMEMEHDIRQSVKELKELRRKRDDQVGCVKERLEVLRTRQLVLRRLIDSILFNVLMPDTWCLRRFSLSNRIREIDPVILQKTVEDASDRNREDRMKFNVVTDLTTMAHIGDLVEVDRSNLHHRAWRLIELKEGRVNDVLSSMIEGQEISSGDLTKAREQFGPAGERQAMRMLKQKKRQAQFDEIIETDQGIDPEHQIPIRLTPDTVVLDNYTDAIRTAINNALSRGTGMAIITKCLRILAIKMPGIPKSATYGAALHTFYHAKNPSIQCVLNDPVKVRDELRAMHQQAPVVDLVDANMRGQWGVPIYLWLPDHDRIVDLIVGRIRLFAQFDLDAFFEVARLQGIALSWITGKESNALHKESFVIPGSPNARAIRADLKDGSSQTLLSGFFARPIVDLTTPQELINMIKSFDEQLRKGGIYLDQAK